MGTKPLLSLWETFPKFVEKKAEKKVMMGTQDLTPTLGRSDLVTWGSHLNHAIKNWKKANCPWCDNCGKIGHLKENCQKIRGKPTDWKHTFNNKDKRAYAASIEEKQPPKQSLFSKEQLEALSKLLSWNTLH